MDILDILSFSIKWIFDRKSILRILGYRPEVICLVRVANDDKVLLIKPQADSSIWSPPQEGIKPNETIEEAAKRCLEVELGLKENKIQFRKSIWLGKRLLPSKRWDERELHYSARGIFGGPKMIGKSYFAALIVADPGAMIKPNSAEIKEWNWVKIDDCRNWLKNVEPEKLQILSSALDSLLQNSDTI